MFDDKFINDISDDEIVQLVVNHVSERQHLEFKVTVNHKEDRDRVEVLRDIVSFANGGGGYIIVGIRDDGKGRAQKFEPQLVGDIEGIRQSIMSLCHDHIDGRIQGMEVVARQVKGNPLVLVRVPDSAESPHMVTYGNRTDFYARYQDGKREMTRDEIRDAFMQDTVAVRLDQIENTLTRMSQEMLARIDSMLSQRGMGERKD